MAPKKSKTVKKAGKAPKATKAKKSTKAAPDYLKIIWGKITTPTGTFKDAICVDRAVREWNWKESTPIVQHSPGITKELVESLMKPNTSVVILSRGFDGVLQIAFDYQAWGRSKGVEVHALLSPAAAKMYNQTLSKKRHVLALLHSTC
jgi:hypothetical protein